MPRREQEHEHDAGDEAADVRHVGDAGGLSGHDLHLRYDLEDDAEAEQWAERTLPVQAGMRSVGMFLLGWALLLGGVLLALWKTGVLQYIDTTWTVIGLFIAVGLGIILSVVWSRPRAIIE